MERTTMMHRYGTILISLLLLAAAPLSAQYFSGEIPDVVTIIDWQVTLPDGEWVKHTAVDGGEAKLRIKHEQLPYWLKFDLSVLDAEKGVLGLSVFRGSTRGREAKANGMEDPLFDRQPFAETSVGLASPTRLAIASDFEVDIKISSVRQLSAAEFLERTGTQVDKKPVGSCCITCNSTTSCDCGVCTSCGGCCQAGCACTDCEN
jgi:hypothetical protein